MNLLWLALQAKASPCEILHDGLPVAALDCTIPGAWTLRCALPQDGGQVSITAAMPSRGLEGQTRLPLTAGRTIELPLSGPGARAGVFVVDSPQLGLLPGQAIGPNQLCPIVQPDVAPGAPRAPVRLEITAKSHPRLGQSERIENGVTIREPAYTDGKRFASLAIDVLQRPVGTIPILAGPPPREAPEEIRGQLQLLDPNGSGSIGFRGVRRVLPLDSGDVTLLIADFVAPEVDAATGGDGASFLVADLARWLAGEPDSLLGIVAWSRSKFEPALLGTTGSALVFRPMVALGRTWWEASTDRLSVRVSVHNDRLRTAIAWRAAPWDPDVRAAIDEATEF